MDFARYRTLCACFAWAKDRRDACLDYRIVISSFRRCSGKEAYSEYGTTGLVEFLQLLKRGTAERGEGGRMIARNLCGPITNSLPSTRALLNILVVRDVVIPLMIG